MINKRYRLTADEAQVVFKYRGVKAAAEEATEAPAAAPGARPPLLGAPFQQVCATVHMA